MIRSVVAAWLSLVLVVGMALTTPGGPALAQDKPEPQKSPEEPKKPDEPKKDEPKKDEPKKEEPKKDEPKKDEPKKDEPKKEEPKKDEPKKEEPKKPETPPRTPSEAPRTLTEGRGPVRRPGPANAKVKPYDEIITPETKSDNGLFMVHRLEDRIMYEIYPDLLGKEMLWVTQIEKTGNGAGYGGTIRWGTGSIRWELRNEDVLLRDVRYDIRAETKDPIHDAVKASSVEPIIAVLPVQGLRQG